jgi:hypothetical protein
MRCGLRMNVTVQFPGGLQYLYTNACTKNVGTGWNAVRRVLEKPLRDEGMMHEEGGANTPDPK